MRETVLGCWPRLVGVAISCVSLLGTTTASAEDPDPAQCCNNQVFASFYWPGPIAIAVTSQGIDRVLFSGSPFAQIQWKDPALSNPKSRSGNHAAQCTGTEINPPGNGDLVMAPQLYFSIDLLPDLPPMVERQPRGKLTAIYAGFRMKPINGWYPEETKLGVFGASFSTHVRKTPASDKEFIRLPTDGRESASGFSLPIDLEKIRNARRLDDEGEISMLPCAVYEDFGFTEWIIYSRLVEDGVEISHRQVKRGYDTLALTGNTGLMTQRYKIGATVQVSNLTFRIVEIVKPDDQVVPAAWINIADIDVVRPRQN